MRNDVLRCCRGWVVAALSLLGIIVWAADPPAAPPAGDPSVVDKPNWQVGDTWIVETVTERIQARDKKTVANPPRIRWQFRVAGIEKLAGQDCYRVDVECLAQGRTRPKTSVWCDKENMCMRQFQTQVAFDGRYQTIQESYDYAKGQATPIVASINALPLAMPAFLPRGSKAIGDFQFTSQPLPAGSKDPSILRFSQSVKQEVAGIDPKMLAKVLPQYSKNMEVKPISQVKLSTLRDSVTQLWRKDAPWPVYSTNGRTQAWLVSTGNPN